MFLPVYDVPAIVYQHQEVAFHCEAELLETVKFGKLEFRRYRIADATLPANEGTVGVFRSQVAWQNPKLVKKTIYFFHAGNANDRQLIDLGAQDTLTAMDADRSLDSVQIVAPASGNSFLSEIYESWLWNSVLPWAETGTQTDAKSRYTSGASMGGFVSLSLFIKHTEMFAGVSANAPALLTWDFYKPEAAQAYADQAHIPLSTAQFLAQFFSASFESRNAYDLRDPLHLIDQLVQNSLADKVVYLDVGELDDLGLQGTTQTLYQKFQALNPKKLSYEVVTGAHHDPAYMSKQLRKMLEFLSFE